MKGCLINEKLKGLGMKQSWPEYFPTFPSRHWWKPQKTPPSRHWRKPQKTPRQDRQHSSWNLSLVPPKQKFRSFIVSKCVWFVAYEWYLYRQKTNSRSERS